MLERIQKTRLPLQYRRRELFDLDWHFHLGDTEGAAREHFDDGGWRQVTLPHDWSIEGQFDIHAPTGGAGAYLPAGIGWYRKTFEIAPKDLDGSVLMEFGGVMSNSSVYINGNCVGNRPYGYISFCYDITEFLHAGSNTVAVKVDNSHEPNSRWYAGAGIYRHTYLIRTSKAHVPFSGIWAATPKVGQDSAIAEIRTEVCNGFEDCRALTVQLALIAPDGTVAAEGSEEHTVEAGQTRTYVQRLELRAPILWSLDTPEVYRVRATILESGAPLDDAASSFGVRQFGYSLTDGFTINGEKVFIKGLCMHQNMGCNGIAVPERLLEETLLKLKRAGCNGIRLSHYPHSPEMMDLLDTIGFVAIGEAFDEWAICRPKTADVGTDGGEGERDFGYAEYFREWNVRDLTDYLRRDRNHPSVAFWSIGNEIFEQNYPEGGPMAREMVARVHRLDPSRPVTAACCNTSGMDVLTTTDAYMDALDIIGVNYVDHWGLNKETYYFKLHEKFPDKIILGNEHVSSGGIRGKFDLYEHENCWYTMYYNKMIDIEQRHKFLYSHPYVLGDFMWTGIDYLGEAPWPEITPSTGMLDTCGFEKDGYQLLRSIWQNKETVLELVPHWSFPGHEGEAIPVVCYTNCDYAELFVNGQSYGRQSWQFPRPGMSGSFFHFERPRLEITTSDLHLMWQVPYQPGELRVVGYKDGVVAAETVVRTAGAPARMLVTANAAEICADRQDAFKVCVQIMDENGTPVPHAACPVTIHVEGAGALQGTDNGSPYVGSGYRCGTKETFNGMMCAVIRSNGEKGAIRVTVETEFGRQEICCAAV